MPPIPWKRWVRDFCIFLVVLSLIELWQARGLVRGIIPFSIESVPTLSPSPVPTSRDPKYTLIYVFAPWCGVCQYSAPNLNRLQGLDFRVEALALSWEDVNDVQAFVEKTGLKVPVRIGQSQEEAALGISAYPSHFLLSPEGKILRGWTGYTTTPGFFWKIYLSRLWDMIS